LAFEDEEVSEVLFKGVSPLKEMFKFGESVRLFIWVAVGRIEPCSELSIGVRVIEGGDDVLSLPGGGGRAFEVGKDKGDFCSVQAVGLVSSMYISHSWKEFFALCITSHELCWFVGF